MPCYGAVMNAPTTVRMTVAQFLDWASARRAHLSYDEPKWELFDGVPEMQEHERWVHGQVKVAVYLALRAAVARSGLVLEVALDSIGVSISEHETYRPEVVVFPQGLIADEDRIAPAPLIVVEVLSPSTLNKDLRIKTAGYSGVDSIAHYLIVDADRSEIIHFARNGSLLRQTTAPVSSGSLRLDPPGLDLIVADAFHWHRDPPLATISALTDHRPQP